MQLWQTTKHECECERVMANEKSISENRDGSSPLRALSKKPLRSQGITSRIRNYLTVHPESMPKHVCKALGIDYETYRNMVSVVKSTLRSHYGHGRPHRPHRLVWTTMLSSEDLTVVKGACADHKVKHRWYRCSNRNRMICFIGDEASVKIWETGRVRIEPHMNMSEKDCQDFLWETLVMGAGVHSKHANQIVNSLETASRHVVFPIGGSLPPFRINHYRNSLGISICADKSHVNALEIEESWPPWVKVLISRSLERAKADLALAKNLESHVEVMKDIRKEGKNIVSATEKLNEILDKRITTSSSPPSQRSVYLGQNRWQDSEGRIFIRIGRWRRI